MRWRRTGLVIAVLLAGCSDDGGSDQPAEDPYPQVSPADAATSSTSSTTTTTVDQGTTTTTTTVDQGTTLVAHEIESDDGTTGHYELTLTDDGLLCFEAHLTNDDPAIARGLGSGISECIGDEVAITPLDETMSVSVGSIDGDRRYGYVWGRAAASVADLRVAFADGTHQIVAIAQQSGIGVFAVVIDTVTAGEAQTLEALDANGTVLATEIITNFLRAGPTYPTVTPTSTAPTTTYPTVGG